MSLTRIKEWFYCQIAAIENSVARFQNKDFLEAVAAGCAMVAAADGTIDSKEKETMAGFIQRDEALKMFDISQALASFNKFASHFEFNVMIGKAEALKAIRKIKANEEAARILIRVCSAIGLADGDFNDSEREVIREICAELDLMPSDFGL